MGLVRQFVGVVGAELQGKVLQKQTASVRRYAMGPTQVIEARQK